VLLPKLVTTLRGYDRRQFTSDATAGVIVGIVALPLAIAFGIASGVTPAQGLYTAIIAGFLISALGGSRVQIGGPTGAFVVVVYAIVQRYGVSGLAAATLMAGLILVLLGLFKLGTIIKFIPHPLVTGFTSGIAVIIASNELPDFFGLRVEKVPAEFVEKLEALWNAASTVNPWAVGIAAFTVLLLVAWRRLNWRFPGPMVALIVTAAVVRLFHLPVETIGSRFGVIDLAFPRPQLPSLSLAELRGLVGPAFTIAALGAIESLLSAMVADGMIGGRHRSNMELVAQGVANIASPLFGGIPATGAIARTATNIRSGARTPVSGMVHALTLLVILVVAAPLARFIPLATLAAILFVVAYNMSEWREVRTIVKLSRADIIVWVMTFALTVLADLTVAVEIGMLFAALLYIYRVSQTTTVVPVTEEYIEDGRPHVLQDKLLPPYVLVLRIHGPFLFGATEKLSEATFDVESLAPVVILRLRNMTAIDATGLHELEKLATRLRATGRTLLLCGARSQPEQFLRQSPFLRYLGKENMLPHVEAALSRAREVYEGRGGDYSIVPTR